MHMLNAAYESVGCLYIGFVVLGCLNFCVSLNEGTRSHFSRYVTKLAIDSVNAAICLICRYFRGSSNFGYYVFLSCWMCCANSVFSSRACAESNSSRC